LLSIPDLKIPHHRFIFVLGGEAGYDGAAIGKFVAEIHVKDSDFLPLSARNKHKFQKGTFALPVSCPEKPDN
jgi:hypothetical protein